MILRYPEDLHERRHGITEMAIGEWLHPFIEVEGGIELGRIEAVTVGGRPVHFIVEEQTPVPLTDRLRVRIGFEWPD